MAKDDAEIELIAKSIVKLNEAKLNQYVVGPLFARLLHVLNKTDLALEYLNHEVYFVNKNLKCISIQPDLFF